MPVSLSQFQSSIEIENIESVIYGVNTTVNFTVVNPITVKWAIFDSEGNVVREGVGLDNISVNLTAGNYSIQINNTGNENYTSSDATAIFEVQKAGSKIEITEITNATYNNTVKVKFTCENQTEAIYLIYLNDDKETFVLSSENFTIINNNEIILPLLDVGNYTIQFAIFGDDNYTTSFAPENFTVSKYTPVINVTVSDVNYPESIVINITSDVSGDYEVKIGNIVQDVVLQYNQTKTITLPLLDANENGYDINVTYAETANYNGAFNDSESVKVFKAASSVLIDPIVNVTYPDKVEVYYVENKTSLAVKITKKDGSEVLVVGDDKITPTKVIIDDLASGDYTIIINNTENTNYNSSIAEANFTISKATPTITVEVEDVTYDANVTVKVTSDVSGSYNVSVGTSSQIVTLEANVIVFYLKFYAKNFSNQFS